MPATSVTQIFFDELNPERCTEFETGPVFGNLDLNLDHHLPVTFDHTEPNVSTVGISNSLLLGHQVSAVRTIVKSAGLSESQELRPS